MNTEKIIALINAPQNILSLDVTNLVIILALILEPPLKFITTFNFLE